MVRRQRARAARVTRYLSENGATRISIDATGLFADATMTVAHAERAFGTELARFRTGAGTRFVAPISARAASVVPAALAAPRAGSSGSTRARSLELDRDRARRHRGVPSSGPHTGTSSGCPGGSVGGHLAGRPAASRRTSTSPPTTSSRCTPPASRPGRDRGADRDRWLQGLATSTRSRSASGCRCPTLERLRGRRRSPVHCARRRGDARPRGARRGRAGPEADRRSTSRTRRAANTLRAMTAPLERTAANSRRSISASLGLCEPDVIGAISSAGLDDAEASLAAPAATGITYLASSGDDGSADCLDDNGNPVHQLAVNYPASSWWVTGVGGTNFALNAVEPDHRAGRLERHRRAAGSAGGGGLSEPLRPAQLPERRHRVERPRRPRRLDARRHRSPATRSTARPARRTAPAPESAPGRRSAARAPRRRCSPAASRSSTAAARRRALQDLGLVNPLLYSARQGRRRGHVFDDVTVGDNDVFLPRVRGGALGCCAAAPGFDDASGWGSVNVAAFSRTRAGASPSRRCVRVALSLPGRQQPRSRRERSRRRSPARPPAWSARTRWSRSAARSPFESRLEDRHAPAAGSVAVS